MKANDIIGTTPGPVWSFTIGVAAPSNLTVTNYASNSVALSWVDHSSNETQFLIERKTGAGGTYAQIGTASANITTFTDSGANGPLPNTVYFYRVRAWDGVSVFSSYASETSIATLAATPGGLSASDGLFNDHVALAWNAATGEASYQVYRNTINDPASASMIGNPTTSSFNDSVLSANVTYFYWVASYNSASIASPKSASDTGFVDSIAPTISTQSFQSQVGPPYLSFTFSETVAAISASNLSLTNLDQSGGAVPMIGSVSYASNTAEFFLDVAMPDGDFRATVTGVTDAAGNALAGANTYDFCFLRGDATGDRAINALDFNALATHFGSAGAGFSGGDFNFDGAVDTQDFSAMALRWGTTLPSAAPLPGRPLTASLFSATAVSATVGLPSDPSVDDALVGV